MLGWVRLGSACPSLTYGILKYKVRNLEDSKHKTLRGQLSKAAANLADETRVALAAVDCTQNKDLCKDQKVKTPQILYYYYFKEREEYKEEHTAEAFEKFLTDKLKADEIKEEPEEPAKKPR